MLNISYLSNIGDKAILNIFLLLNLEEKWIFKMISNRNLVTLFNLFVCIHINYVNGYPCKDGSDSDDCTCFTGTSGAIGTCNCSPTSVRQGQPCASYLVDGNAVDSVRLQYIYYELTNSWILKFLSSGVC